MPLPNRADSGLLSLLVAAVALSCIEPMAPDPDEKFDIALDMPTWVAGPVRQAFEDAAATWAAILAETEFQDVSIDGKTNCGERVVTIGDVDDVLIVVSFPLSIDGSLALGGVCVARAGSHEPIVGYVTIDRSELAELVEWGLLYEVALHEIAHALTGPGRKPLSIVTLQALADMGYSVDLSMADDYQLPDEPSGPEEGHWPVINLDGDLQHGPIILVDDYARARR